MFAGTIEKKSRILKVERDKDLLRARISKPAAWKLAVGQSVNVDGVCSTVVRTAVGWFDVEYVPETLSKTTVSQFVKGRMVNLERSLKKGDRIDGHPVQGHVDMRTPVREVKVRGTSRELTIKPSAQLSRRVHIHGSIALNGVSLTVAQKHGPNITVALVPHTLRVTNLGELKVGDEVNVEIDLLSRYESVATRSSR